MDGGWTHSPPVVQVPETRLRRQKLGFARGLWIPLRLGFLAQTPPFCALLRTHSRGRDSRCRCCSVPLADRSPVTDRLARSIEERPRCLPLRTRRRFLGWVGSVLPCSFAPRARGGTLDVALDVGEPSGFLGAQHIHVAGRLELGLSKSLILGLVNKDIARWRSPRSSAPRSDFRTEVTQHVAGRPLAAHSLRGRSLEGR